MGILNYKNSRPIIKEICDGYCIVSFKDNFIKGLRKDFNKQADKDYEKMQKSCLENNGIPVIPIDYNANQAKYRMKMESALDNEGIVGIKIVESNECDFSVDDYNYLESELINKKAEFMLLNNNEENVFICANNLHNLNLITNTLYKEIINKREKAGLNITKKDGFLNKDISIDEQQFIKDEIIEEITKGLYIGDEQLAINLLASKDYFSKIILQEKHRIDIEKILSFLQINYILIDNSIIVTKNTLSLINNIIDDYIHGAITVKDKNIYGLNIKREINKEIDNGNKQSIDNIINKLKDKNIEKEIITKEQEQIK